MNRPQRVVTPTIENTPTPEGSSLIPDSATSSPPQSGGSLSQHSRQQSSSITPPTSIDLYEPLQQEDAVRHNAQSGPSSLDATEGSNVSGLNDEIEHVWGDSEDYVSIGAQFRNTTFENATLGGASRRSVRDYVNQHDIPAGLSALRIAILVFVSLVAVAFISFAWHHIYVLSKAGDVDPLHTKFILVISTLGLAVSASTAAAVFRHHLMVTLLVFIAVILLGENIRRGIGCFVPIAA